MDAGNRGIVKLSTSSASLTPWLRVGLLCICAALVLVRYTRRPQMFFHQVFEGPDATSCGRPAICKPTHSAVELNDSIWGDLKRSMRSFNGSSRSPCWIAWWNRSISFQLNSAFCFGKKIIARANPLYGRYHCLPGLMLIGNPKCGTTDVFERATKHPLLARSRHKEPHWFTRHASLNSFDRRRDNGTTRRSYLQNWNANEVRQENLLTFEASPSTLWDLGRTNLKQLPHGILVPEGLRYLLGARVKFVVCLCDPIQRMLSDYLAIGVQSYIDDIKRIKGVNLDSNKTSQLTEGLQSPTYFHRHVQSAVSNFERCELSATLLECLYLEPYNAHTPRPWLAVGATGHFLQVWLRYFPPENFVVIRSETYYKKPAPVIEKVLTFAGLPPMSESTLQAVSQMKPGLWLV